MELGLDKIDTDQTNINFIPIFGTDKIIRKFIVNFVESIKRYTTSSFIFASLSRKNIIYKRHLKTADTT